jgi:Cu(I)/Ag(I) efflux system membrane fusion protein
MNRLGIFAVLALGLGVGAAGHYLYVNPPREVKSFLSAWRLPEQITSFLSAWSNTAADQEVIYYRDPSGAPYWSATPKKDSSGREFLPVYENEELSFYPAPQGSPPNAATETNATAGALPGERKVLYYRNPMGLPDTSPVPKKDTMGMDYIPVYADEQEERDSVKVSLDKVQRIGVKTEKVAARVISRSVRGVGTVQHDESLLSIVTVRSDGYVEKLFVNKTGQHVEKGEALFRFYSPQIQLAQADLLVAVRTHGKDRGTLGSDLDGAMQKLRNLDVPETRIDEVRKTMNNPRTIDWASPATGDVIEKKVIEGQRVAAGAELFRIIDHSRVWVVAEVAEADIAEINLGMPTTVTLRAFATQPHEGVVTFIYPEMMKPETRTVAVRIELSNTDGRLKPGMYADVVFHANGEDDPPTVVSDSAVIDSGTRQVVLVAKGDGRFEPREIKLGRRGDGYVEVKQGLKAGEEVVTSANFLIDAESNLKAAFQTFGQGEKPQ